MSLVWLLPFVAGLADASLRSVMKVSRAPSLALVGAGYLCVLPIYAVWLAIEGLPEVQPGLLWVVLLHAPLMALAQVLTVLAHRSSALVLTAPYLALTPAYLLVVAPLLGAGTPSSAGLAGVLVLTIGIYVLNTQQGQVGLLEPFQRLRADRGAKLMFAVGALYAVTTSLDYRGFAAAGAPVFLLVDHALVGLGCLALAWIDRRRRPGEPGASLASAVAFAAALGGATVPHLLAFAWIPNVPYVVAVKRGGSIAFAVAAGVLLGYLAKSTERRQVELAHLRYRLAGAFIIILGMLLVILAG